MHLRSLACVSIVYPGQLYILTLFLWRRKYVADWDAGRICLSIYQGLRICDQPFYAVLKIFTVIQLHWQWNFKIVMPMYSSENIEKCWEWFHTIGTHGLMRQLRLGNGLEIDDVKVERTVTFTKLSDTKATPMLLDLAPPDSLAHS